CLSYHLSATAPVSPYTLSLHDALPICDHRLARAPGGTTQSKMDGQRADAQQSGIDLAAARPHAAALVPDAVSALRGAMAVEPPELLNPDSTCMESRPTPARVRGGASRVTTLRVRDSAEWRPAPGPDRRRR